MIGNTTGHAQANLGKKRDGIMSDRVRKPMSIRNGDVDRQNEEIRVLYRQCPGEENQSVQLAIADSREVENRNSLQSSKRTRATEPALQGVPASVDKIFFVI